MVIDRSNCLTERFQY